MFFLILIFIQDLKFRMIHILLPLSIFCIAIYNYYFLNKMRLNIVLINTFFFIGTMVILLLYMVIKNKQFLNPFQNYFGFGDFLFYLSITPLFALKNYILYFIFSMVFAIIIQKTFTKKINQENVPLAGLSALFLALILIFDFVSDFQKITLL